MKRRSINVQLSRAPNSYQIQVGDGLLSDCGTWSRKILGPDARCIAVVSNRKVFGLYGETVSDSLRSAGFTVSRFLIKDGERFKSLETAGAALRFFSEQRLSRTDAVVALGGGVVGDLAGFASAVYLRGVRVLHIPTTLLAMIDASVGGKTGVNLADGKNLVGAFHQPAGVLADVDVLKTLERRELTAGFCEAIKQAAVGGRSLLARTSELLGAVPVGKFSKITHASSRSQLSDLIAAHVEFKARIVSADERESSKNLSSRSRKILNFGHTFAHALEKVTDYKQFRHGEAVGHGILFAAELSKSLALCSEKDVNLLYDVVHRAGPLPALAGINQNNLIDALRFDKKRAGGALQWVLLKAIGKPLIVSDDDIPRAILNRVVKRSLQNRA